MNYPAASNGVSTGNYYRPKGRGIKSLFAKGGLNVSTAKSHLIKPLQAPSGWQLNRAKGRAVRSTGHPDGVFILSHYHTIKISRNVESCIDPWLR